MSHVVQELRKAFDHVGLSSAINPLGSIKFNENGACIEDFSFWVPEDYTFQAPAVDDRWRRVEDEKPEEAQMVLIWPFFGGAFAALFLKSKFWRHGETCPATHWMPLPARPP